MSVIVVLVGKSNVNKEGNIKIIMNEVTTAVNY